MENMVNKPVRMPLNVCLDFLNQNLFIVSKETPKGKF